MSCIYSLQVNNALLSSWTPGYFTKVPALCVKIRLGTEKRRTRVAKKTTFPQWNEVFTLEVPASSPNPDLIVKLKGNSGLFSKTLAVATARLSDLLQISYPGELQLYAPHKRPSTLTVAGVISLCLRVIGEKQRAEAELNSASADVDRFKFPSDSIYITSPRSLGAAKDDAGEQRNPYQPLASLVENTRVFMRICDTVAAFHPYSYAAWKAVSVLYEAVHLQIELDQRVVGLLQLMDEVYDFVNHIDTLQDKIDLLQTRIIEFLRQSTECCLFIRQYSRAGFARRIYDLGTQAQKVAQFEARLNDLKRALVEGTSLHTTFVSARISETVDVLYLRQVLSPDELDASNRSGCIPGTRAEYLNEIMGWFCSESQQNILWLCGVAGCGKSTISVTVADICRNMRRLGAYLPFMRGRSGPASVIRTIAYWLSSFDQTIARCVTEAVRINNAIATASLEKQFEKLLFEPLMEAAKSIHGPIAIILDALDECGSPETRRPLLKLITDSFTKLPPNFRLIITSRHESDFNRALCNPSIRKVELRHSSTAGRKDVLCYLAHELHCLFSDFNIEAPTDWPREENLSLLGRVADGLFVWASTAIKHVRSKRDDPFEALESLLSYCRTKETARCPSSHFGLSELYYSVLENSGISWEEEDSRERFSQVLGLILLAKAPLSIAAIDGILGLRTGSSCQYVIACLQSVLEYTPNDPNVPVRIFHTSFADYLLVKERESQPWFINIPKQRHFFAEQCFNVMEKKLRFNICGLESSFMRNDQVHEIAHMIESNIPPALLYSCLFWAEHLCDVPHSYDAIGLTTKLETFVKCHFLYWLEVLSLTKRFTRSAGRALLEAITWTPTGSSELSSFLWDAYWLISVFSTPISQSVPHIYLSTLALTKGVSIVADHYSKCHPTAQVSSFGSIQRATCMKVFRGSAGSVNSVAFSPDGKRIVSGSKDGMVYVRDSESGEIMTRPLAGHGGAVLSVSFCHDGKRIISGSYDGTIYVWDAKDGKIVSGPLCGHEGAVFSVSMSPDGRSIASGSGDGTVRIWNASDGSHSYSLVKGSGAISCSVVFSPDSKRVASGFGDGVIRVWDRESRACIFDPFKAHAELVYTVTISQDGKRIASGSFDMSVRVWDAETGALISDLCSGHTGPVLSVAFAPSGNHIASGSEDKTIRVWDARSGELVSGPFRGHTGPVFSIAFSPDGKRIASGSGDETIRIWDAGSGEVSTGPIEGHTKQIHSIAVSPDGSRIASGSSDMTVRIWDAESGALVCGPLEGHGGAVLSVDFSPDGRHVVSGSLDETIRIWDAGNGRLICRPGKDGYILSGNHLPTGERVAGLVGNIIRAWFSEDGEVIYEPADRHVGPVYSVAFSPNGECIASGSADKAIAIWDAKTGSILSGPLKGHKKGVTSVAFSPNGARVVSGSHDETVRIWDVESGDLLSIIRGHTGTVCSVAYSPDGERIVSGSYDKTIRAWNARRGTIALGPLTGHTGYVHSVCFSPDGKHIVSSSEDRTIRVWDTSGKLAFGPLEGHADGVRSVRCLPDGKHIVSSSRDKVIRVWNVEGERADLVKPSDETSNSSDDRFVLDTQNSVGDNNASNTDSETDRVQEYKNVSSRWTVSDDGWVLGDKGVLLLWVPSDMLPTLWRSSNTAVFNCRFSTRLDLAGSSIGRGWYKEYGATGV